MNTFADRFRETLKQKGLKKQKEIAAIIGISNGYLSELLSGKKLPSEMLLSLIESKLGINSKWLLNGELPMFMKVSKEAGLEKPLKVAEEGGICKDFVFVPQINGNISPGGRLVEDRMIEMKIAFRQGWIQRRGDPKNMSLIRVSGDSMEPTLISGDLVLVDHNRNYIDPQGGIYAIIIDDTIMIKRVQILFPSKKIRIISDNNRYNPVDVEMDSVRIYGKVIWFGREIDR